MHTLKPLDVEAVTAAARATRRIVTIEEHSVLGGLGGAVAETLCEAGHPRPPFSPHRPPLRVPQGRGRSGLFAKSAGIGRALPLPPRKRFSRREMIADAAPAPATRSNHGFSASHSYPAVSRSGRRSGGIRDSRLPARSLTSTRPRDFLQNLDVIVRSGARSQHRGRHRLQLRRTIHHVDASTTAASRRCAWRTTWKKEVGAGHFFITTNMIGSPRFVSADDLRDLRRRGHVVGSHSHTHPAVFRCLTEAEMLREWQTSCQTLSAILQEPITTASVPGGDMNRMTADTAARAGIRSLFTSEMTLRALETRRPHLLRTVLSKTRHQPASHRRLRPLPRPAETLPDPTLQADHQETLRTALLPPPKPAPLIAMLNGKTVTVVLPPTRRKKP